MTNTESKDELIADFLSQFDSNNEIDCNLLRENFVKYYTEEKISSLALEDYYKTGKQDTFCYRLEWELKSLSSMWNVHPDFYGVYINKSGDTMINRTLTKIYGNDFNEAFCHEKRSIIKLLENGKNEDYVKVRKSDINSLIRFKLLSVYYPNKFYPVCSIKTAEYYCKVFSISIRDNGNKMTDLNHLLVDWKNKNLPSEWTLHKTMAFSDWLWRGNKRIVQ